MDDLRIPRSDRNAFIAGSFRDTADLDYLAARLLHRRNLTGQFLWMSYQSIEKYLKAILLYADKSTIKLGHNVVKALAEVRKIDKLGFNVTQRAEEFITYLNTYGGDRYFSSLRVASGDELFDLDQTVWEVRRFCDDFFFPHNEACLRKHDQARLLYVQGTKIYEAKAKFRLTPKGCLEIILDEKKQPALRAELVWKNFCFGGRNRKRITYTRQGTWAQPNNFMRPNIVDWAVEKVRLPPGVEDKMREKLRNKKG